MDKNRYKYRYNSIKKKVLVIFWIAMQVLLAVVIIAGHFYELEELKKQSIHETQQAKELYNFEINREKILLKKLILSIKNIPKIKNVFISKTPSKNLKKIYKTYKDTYNIRGINFYNEDNALILSIASYREYKTSGHYSLIKSSIKMDSFSGIDISHNGTIELHSIEPVIIDDNLYGFIEVYKPLKKIASKIKSIIKSDIIITIDKNYLKQSLTERNSNVQFNWNKFDKFVIKEQSFKTLPDSIEKFLHFSYNKPNERMYDLIDNNNSYSINMSLFKDSGNNTFGKFIIISNTSVRKKSLFKLMYIVIISFILIGAVLLYFFSKFLEKIIKILIDIHRNFNLNIEELNETKESLTTAKDELHRANIKSEMENEAKSEFIYNISQEIKSPIDEVLSSSSLLLESEQNPKKKRLTQKIISSSNSILSVMTNIIDFFAMESDNLKIDKKQFNIRSIINDITNIYSITAMARQINFSTIIDHNIPEKVIGDPFRIKQIIDILIDNAFQFTEKGEITLEVSMQEQHGESTTLFFSISDTGIGIEEDQKNHIFKSIMDPQRIILYNFKRTGLGLAISNKLIHIMNGKIGVKSKLDSGSVFWFTIPLKTVKDNNKNREKIASSLKGIKILSINNRGRLDFIRDIAAKWQCQYDEVTTIDNTVKKLKQAIDINKPYEFLITSMVINESNKKKVKQIIKNHPEFKKTKLIIIFPSGCQIDTKETIQLGFSAYFTFPINEIILSHALRILLSEKTEGTENLILSRYSTLDIIRQNTQILVIEPDINNLKFILCELHRQGFHGDSIFNKNEVLNALNKFNYSIIFISVDFDSSEDEILIREIKNKIGNKIKILAIMKNNDEKKYLQSNIKSYVTDCITFQNLSERLNELLIISI